MYDIIIIGAGVAGLTSAIYSLRANKKVLILEKQSYGGQIIKANNVKNYPGYSSISGFDLATMMYQQVKELEGEFKFEEVIKITPSKEVVTTKNTYQARSIIIASGVASRKLNLVQEEKLIGKGVSYCATCDGNFYKGQEVMVVGGGNTALEDVLYLSDLCKKVILVHRRDNFRADESLVDSIRKKENIEIIYNSIVEKVNGTEKLESVEVFNSITKEKKTIPVAGLFVAVGQIPNNKKMEGLLELDENGYILADEDCHTNIEGIFAAGDIRKKSLRQLVTATSDGAVAATEAIKYLKS